MDASHLLAQSVLIFAVITFVAIIITALYDCIFGEYEDWYSFDEVQGEVVQLKNIYPIEHEFTGWNCLVHVVDTKGRTKVYKTSTMLYRILEENKKYNFFIRDNAIWKVIEVDTKLTFKAKWSFGG